MSFDWKGLIGGLAPTIATVASGGNPLVGAAVGALSTAILGKKDGTPEEITAQIQAVKTSGDPAKAAELELQLKQAEYDFKTKMQEFGIRLEELDVKREEIAAGDRKDARGMHVEELRTDDRFARRFVYWYAIGMTTLSFVYFFAVTFIPVNPDQSDMANIILGFLLGTGLSTIVGFFFGTTHGSLAKNKQIEDLALKVPPKGV